LGHVTTPAARLFSLRLENSRKAERKTNGEN
jgi:hypothetical protein